jgi:heme A synthase
LAVTTQLTGLKEMEAMINRRYANYAWGVLALNILVIIWGAFVRATGSGAGCGDHWPLCNGQVIPQPTEIATVIEFSHRVTSGLALLAVFGMLVWSFRAYPKGHLVRRGAIATTILIILEALLGAGLVLLQYVAFNVSIERAFWMGAHLINTLLLTGALTLTAWWASGGRSLRLRGQGAIGATFWLAVAGMMLLSVSGAIAALGDTLTIAGGISPEENVIVATLVELRIFHPLIAIVTGALVFLAVQVTNSRRPTRETLRFGWAAAGLFALQLLLGTLNVILKAPVWLQMVHLLVTMVIWVLLVLFGAAALAAPAARPQDDVASPRASLPRRSTA